MHEISLVSSMSFIFVYMNEFNDIIKPHIVVINTAYDGNWQLPIYGHLLTIICCVAVLTVKTSYLSVNHLQPLRSKYYFITCFNN